MKNNNLIFCAIIGLLFSGCMVQRASLKTFIDPSIQAASVKSVVVFPMRNTAFSPGETMEMDRAITQAFIQKNGSVTTTGTTEADAMLNKENLAGEFAQFLADFEKSGIANCIVLK